MAILTARLVGIVPRKQAGVERAGALAAARVPAKPRQMRAMLTEYPKLTIGAKFAPALNLDRVNEASRRQANRRHGACALVRSASDGRADPLARNCRPMRRGFPSGSDNDGFVTAH
jgi:hypothetical protein